MSILKVEGLTKNYGNKHRKQEVLKGIDFTIEKGEFVTIMGPSGSGKTTLLNVISSIDYITSDTVEINGHVMNKMSNKALEDFRNREIGIIFQKYSDLNKLIVFILLMIP